YVTVVLNGETIIDNARLDGFTGGALFPFEADPGPLMLQGDHGKVWYRNITVTPALRASSVLEREKTGEPGFVQLFPADGIPAGWHVRAWNDVKDPPPAGAVWRVEKGVLHGSEPRGTWLVSEAEYGDFILEFEWKVGAQGNSGCGLRFPPHGDPAFDGLELQMVDPGYYPPGQAVTPGELTGSLYKAVAPAAQAFKPGDWNKYVVTCQGSKVKVTLNGLAVLDVDLEQDGAPVKRHNGSDAPPLKDRPRRGHIGFQELSRGGGHVEIRNARLKSLD
ncbi:MAG TPA: family 16 glycoside hydrolase, partial [Planctomycetota bacterium]|nr:family 16 glycoside hydrolase [Planctomycetota bacterium]